MSSRVDAPLRHEAHSESVNYNAMLVFIDDFEIQIRQGF